MNLVSPYYAVGRQSSGKLDEVQALYKELLPGNSVMPLLSVLSVIVANNLPGKPLWIILVGPASSGKSETLECIRDLPGVFDGDNLSVAGLLSGSPQEEGSTGGLLKEIGDGNAGVILSSDLSSVLAAKRESQDELLAALRVVYDGHYTRKLGTDGGRTFSWHGKAGFTGGATPSIDAQNHFRVQLGERYIFHRMNSNLTPREMAENAIRLATTGTELKTRLHRRIKELLSEVDYPSCLPETPAPFVRRLTSLATLVAESRAVVERETGGKREIISVQPCELPPRLALQLQIHLTALKLLGVDEDLAWRTVVKTGLDSIPQVRSGILNFLYQDADGYPTPEVTSANPHFSEKTVGRVLKDMAAVGLVRYVPNRGPIPARWRLSETVKGFMDEVMAPVVNNQVPILLPAINMSESSTPEPDSPVRRSSRSQGFQSWLDEEEEEEDFLPIPARRYGR